MITYRVAVILGQKRQLDEEEAAAAGPDKKARQEENDVSLTTLTQFIETQPEKMVGPDVSTELCVSHFLYSKIIGLEIHFSTPLFTDICKFQEKSVIVCLKFQLSEVAPVRLSLWHVLSLPLRLLGYAIFGSCNVPNQIQIEIRETLPCCCIHNMANNQVSVFYIHVSKVTIPGELISTIPMRWHNLHPTVNN